MNALPDQRRPRRPHFFWQGALILLPVALMATFGFWAILRQRYAVEKDALERAGEIVQTWPIDFGRIVALRLTRLDGPKGGWLNYLQWAVAAWPDDKIRKQYLSDTNESIIIPNDLADLKAAFPDWKQGAPTLAGFMLQTNGDLYDSRSTPPTPPPWMSAMSAPQYEAWTALESADFASRPASDIDKLARLFEQTAPPADARVCAEFFSLRADSRTESATNAINELIDFAGGHFDVESDSGLPLTTLALAEALNRARECGPTHPLWDELRSEINDPDMLAPSLLDQAAGLVTNNVPLSEGINAMKTLLADKEMQNELSEAVRASGKLNGVTMTNLWVEAMGQRWFCILQPANVWIHTSVSNHPITMTNVYTGVRCYPEPLVTRAFAEALSETRTTVPDYFSIGAELNAMTLVLPPAWNHCGTNPPVGQGLMRRNFQMTLPAGIAGYSTRFEDLPGHPQFTLGVQLTDPALLYARQRQFQLIFGSLIACAALSAIIGFIAALRSFRRQQALSEMKSNFVSSVSHELRAPIASVRLMAENLELGKVQEASRQGEYFRFIVQECRRLSSLIENVLDFSRIEQGRKQYELEPTDMAALARGTVKLMEPYAAEKGVRLEFNSGLQTCEMELDGRAIQQALVNLIDNAIKHSPKGETVIVGLETIALNSQPSTLNLFVSDHGPGIPAEEHAKIFDRFYRLGSELRRETQGVGIGLSIVKHIVETHGGRVLVQSQPGHGSRFAIELAMKDQK